MRDKLTKRELQVVKLIAIGKTSKEIAVDLNVKLRTVELHRYHAMRILGVHNAADLTALVIREEL